VETFYLCASALLAGFVDSIAGGGGLIQLPALFLFLPPELAGSIATVFGTNKLVSMCGTGTAVWQYVRKVPVNWPAILPAGATAFVFSFLGARAVSLLDNRDLRPLVLVLLIGVAFYTWMRKDLGHLHAPHLSPATEKLAALAVGAGIGFYDGFFGPGTGSFLIFIFIGIFGFSFLHASASAKVINLATNISAVLYFASQGHVLYQYALPMALCNVIGALIGARLAILKGNRFVRGLFLALVTIMILRFGYEVVLGGS
jgi:uncharacterized membrane protein YfcA